MKKYFKYRNFMPESFINEKLSKVNKSNSRVYIIFIVLNIILLPINFKFLFSNEKEEVIFQEESNYSNVELNEIINWIEIRCEDVLRIKVDNKKGEVELKSHAATTFLEDKNFKIIKINYDEESKSVKVIHE